MNGSPVSHHRGKGPGVSTFAGGKGAILAETAILVAKTDIASLGRETDVTTRQCNALAGKEPTELRLESVMAWYQACKLLKMEP